ncbi:MAG: hypothetical protein LQ339_007681 [Xanthoria mediterranea]|nr:MAG: hypothetical protein LQ339_007681 [Xanthoria mediterranea]
MFAVRDQENLVHGHQAAAAAKPLNQGVKQLAPKTPGNKTAKLPLRLPLNDENGTTAFGGGKKTVGKGNGNSIFGGKKDGMENKSFVTPIGPRNRAPLGAKTTNAKAKAFQTPAAAQNEHDLGKTIRKSVSARKPKPKAIHPESTKLEDILADKEALDQREIEYMPPNPKDLPDYPDDDLPELDLSAFQGPHRLAGWFEHFANKPDAEGLSFVQRKEMEEKLTNEYLDKKGEAEIQLAIDSAPMSCLCDTECWGDECKQNPIRKEEAQETYRKTMAALEQMIHGPSKKPIKAKGPTISTSKAAVTALSNTKRPVLAAKPPQKPIAPVKRSMPIPSRNKKTPPPTNPSEMRHAAAVAASKTTMGYSKGRATSATMRKAVLPGKENQVPAVVSDYSLPPGAFIKRYGVPRYGSEKWLECKIAGCFDEDYTEDLGEAVTASNDDAVAEYFRQEAMKDFVLEL